MILVTLGTQDKQFKRLLDAIQKEIDNGNIKDRIIVQAGYTKYESKDMEILDLIDKDTFDRYMSECNLLITHGGVGSILTGLKREKRIIACPRLAKYNEHINDHQLEITKHFVNEGYLISYNDGENLKDKLEEIKKFKPKKYRSNTDKIIELIENFIDNN